LEALENVFNYQGTEVRTLTIDSEPWFVAKDVCNVLDMAKVDRAIARLDEDEKGTHTVSTLGGDQEMSIINESGLYSVVMTSRKPEAKNFKRWVTHDVLPEIRKTGSYNVPSFKVPATLKEALILTIEQMELNEKLQAENLLMAPKAVAFDTYMGAKGNMSIGDFAKMLPGCGQKRLFRFLREQGVLISGGVHHNVPYQDQINAGRFTVRAYTVPHNDPDNDENKMQSLLTPKGMEYVARIWSDYKNHSVSVRP
jgi:anti-repressor protein